MSAVISVGHVSKSYGSLRALDDVSFEVAGGEVVAVLGPNGAGKTTTVEILEGFRDRDGGRVSVLGEDPRRAGRAWRARLGLVLQSTSLEPGLTVTELLRLFAGMYPHPRPVDEVLTAADLTDVADLRIGALSGGQQRRVDLAVGIIGNPELLFLDEPTTGFDPSARREAWTTIERLAAGGTTVVLTTHYLEEAERIADRLLVFARGRIVAEGPPGQVGRVANLTELNFTVPPPFVLTDLPGEVASRAQRDGRRVSVAVPSMQLTSALGELLDWARAHQVRLDDLTVGQRSLEDAYLQLTEASYLGRGA